MATSLEDHVASRERAQSARARRSFAPRRAFHDMAARRSFHRSLSKFAAPVVDKPVAILTAWRGTLLDPNGQPYPEAERRRRNDAANELLKASIRSRGLSFYPVVGAGQELIQGVLTANQENGFIVQPIGDMDELHFLDHIQQLLFNPAGGPGQGPFPHTQWGALVKLPSRPPAFLLFHTGRAPTGPQDYTKVKPEGDTAAPRVRQEPHYTQLKYGPRADPAMMDPLDRPDDVGNPRPGTGKPGAGLPGKRFRITNRSQP